MNTIAVIPARGGSKGVPAKNLQPVGGVPLVVRAVRAAASSALVDEVWVSTDDDRIADVAREAGAGVIDRPAELAGDEAGSEAALLHALDQFDDYPQVLVFIQATSPFIDVPALDSAIERVRDGENDVVFSAVETYEFLWTAAGEGINHDPSTRPRRQDREPHYRETGAFYVLDAAGFIQARHRFFGSIGIAEVDQRSAIEIDTLTELELANHLEEKWETPWLYQSAATK
ncbi:MAG: acylneuraminate cytidylyltransferase [Microbacteriaceae bacterium]|jgi:CMP-N-acetylneuraminic acid synthetase|nr:acylneuraminate cytidylyltransferase [Microbacteriaceae bacterium]